MRTGRPPEEGKPRDTPVCVRFTAEDTAGMDKARGSTRRSTYVRDAVRAANAARGIT